LLKALTLGWAIIYAGRTCLYPLLSVIADKLSLTSAQAGALTSTYFIMYVLMQIPGGIIGDRVGLKKVLMLMYTVAALGLLGLGLYGTNYKTLLLFTALHGFGAGGYYPTAYGTMLQVVEAAQRGFSSAVIGIGMAVGLLLGLAVSGPVYEIMDSFQAPFIIMSVPTFAIMICFYLALPDIRGGGQASWQKYKAILLDKDLWLINISTFMALYGFWVAISWGPTFLKIERNFSLGQAGLYTGLMAITAVPGGLVWGRLSDRFGRKRIAQIILPLGGISLFLLSRATTPGVIIGILLLFGLFSNSAYTPVMVALTGDIVGRRYPGNLGAATGIFNCTIMCSAIIAPVVSGYLRDMTGSLTVAIMVGSLVMLAGTLLIFLLPDLNTRLQHG
jgi:MFS family permease